MADAVTVKKNEDHTYKHIHVYFSYTVCDETELSLMWTDKRNITLSHFYIIYATAIYFYQVNEHLSQTPSNGSAYRWAVVSVTEPSSVGSMSRITPGCWTLHTRPPPAVMRGWSLHLKGPGRKKKDMGSPSTVINRTGEVSDLATPCSLDVMVEVTVTW